MQLGKRRFVNIYWHYFLLLRSIIFFVPHKIIMTHLHGWRPQNRILHSWMSSSTISSQCFFIMLHDRGDRKVHFLLFDISEECGCPDYGAEWMTYGNEDTSKLCSIWEVFFKICLFRLSCLFAAKRQCWHGHMGNLQPIVVLANCFSVSHCSSFYL